MLEVGPADLALLTVDHAVDVDPGTGRVSVSVPVRSSPGREGFGPSLVLSHTGEGGPSAFGHGWSLSGASRVTLSTRRGVPTYREASPIYELDGDELVPVRASTPAGDSRPHAEVRGDYRVERYRAAVEARFLRVERWTRLADDRQHFLVRDRLGGVSVFGRQADGRSRIAAPGDPGRTFQWLVELSVDPKGNAIAYEYAAEDTAGVDPGASAELTRWGEEQPQRYLKRVRYGNRTPVTPSMAAGGADLPADPWCFEVLLDYGEHGDDEVPSYDPVRSWPVRSDPFSNGRAGFEVRTYRLCRRVVMVHRFPELGEAPRVVGATELALSEGAEGPVGARLTAVRYRGFRWTGDAVESLATPALAFTYAEPRTDQAFRPAPESADPLPVGIGTRYRWVDLHGDGVPGILADTPDAWRFAEHLGEGRFGPLRGVAELPRRLSLAARLEDFDGDGNLDLVSFGGGLGGGGTGGYYRRERASGRWDGFRAFARQVRLDWGAAQVTWADLDGDGFLDIVVEHEGRLIWYPSEGRDGFADPIELARPDPRAGAVPTLRADPRARTFFADMTGDGLADLVRVDSGRVEYWPNLGHGRFGGGVLMEGAPTFEHGAQLTPARLRFVDLTGSGTADLLYLGEGELQIWHNHGGDGFGPTQRLGGLPFIADPASAQVFDFLADGTPCLVWSSDHAVNAGSAVQYLRLGGDQPPNALVAVASGVGREVRLRYRSSARDYLRDARGERPWSTKLPRHHTVLAEQEVVDLVRGTAQRTRYAYRDGRFDDELRGFAGFGEVTVVEGDAAADPDAVAPTPMTGSRLWFCTGEVDARGEGQPSPGGAGEPLRLPAPRFDELVSGETLAAGHRALVGHLRRHALYALEDADAWPAAPLRTTEHAYRLLALQPGDGDHPPAVLARRSEVLACDHASEVGDPRVDHQLVLELDAFGHATTEAGVLYPRRHPEALGAQRQLEVLLATSTFAHVDTPTRFETGVEVERGRYRLVGASPPAGEVFTLEELRSAAAAALERTLELHEPAPELGPAARRVGWRQRWYWDGDEVAPHGAVGPVTLLHHESEAAFAEAQVEAVLGSGARLDAVSWSDLHYHREGGVLWTRGAVSHYLGGGAFYRLAREEFDDGGRREVAFDPDHLFVVRESDALGLTTRSEPDYQALAAARVVDPDDNVTEALYDPLGYPLATTLYGEQLGADGAPHRAGDEPLLAEPRPARPLPVSAALADPEALIGGASVALFHDLGAFARGDGPPLYGAVTRERPRYGGEGGQAGGDDGSAEGSGRLGVVVELLDGLGRVLQVQRRSDPGPAYQLDSLDPNANPGSLLEPVHAPTRWHVSGREIYDHRGFVRRRYEPCFVAGAGDAPPGVVGAMGVSALLTYDALGRVVREDAPDGTLWRMEYGPWHQLVFDANDTVAESAYAESLASLAAESPQDVRARTLAKALAHAGTPTRLDLDAAGRVIRLTERGEAGEERVTETIYGAMGEPERLVDARGLVAFAYTYDMLGRVLHERSADAGERWSVPDAYGRPVHSWSPRGVHTERRYDLVGRPTEVRVRGPGLAERVTERGEYADAPDEGAALANARGRLRRWYDEAGVVEVVRYDLEGRELEHTRRLRSRYDGPPDWAAPDGEPLEAEVHRSRYRFDSEGRVLEHRSPDGLVRTASYDAEGFVAHLAVGEAAGAWSRAIITATRHNARGQREALGLGNGALTEARYDARTFRLADLVTRRAGGPARTYQDLAYSYDPVGNITHLVDRAQAPAHPQSVLSGLTVGAERDYTYDAHYQLIRATGRVHQALEAGDHRPDRAAADPGVFKGTRHLSLDNGAAVARYTRTYRYDVAGNLTRTRHESASGAWVKELWVSPTSNRSVEAQDANGLPVVDPEARFDAAGNLVRAPHLRSLAWDHADRLSRVVLVDRAAEGLPDDAEVHVYGADHQRVRRIHQRLLDVVTGVVEVTDTLFLDGCELRRVRRGDALWLERLTSRLASDLSGGGSPVATVHRWTRDETGREVDDIGEVKVTFTLTDHLGSATLELDERGDVITYEEYFPFGGTSFIAGRDLRDVALKDLRYTGKIRDDATGLYYFGYRFYAPWIGNWISPDPIGPEDGLNTYRFVHNNPIRFVDPDGLEAGQIERFPVPAGPEAWRRDENAAGLLLEWIESNEVRVGDRLWRFRGGALHWTGEEHLYERNFDESTSRPVGTAKPAPGAHEQASDAGPTEPKGHHAGTLDALRGILGDIGNTLDPVLGEGSGQDGDPTAGGSSEAPSEARVGANVGQGASHDGVHPPREAPHLADLLGLGDRPQPQPLPWELPGVALEDPWSWTPSRPAVDDGVCSADSFRNPHAAGLALSGRCEFAKFVEVRSSCAVCHQVAHGQLRGRAVGAAVAWNASGALSSVAHLGSPGG